ncbi:MAG: hypothetical protein BGO90_01395 [Legionella sp. 40-6]|nr:FAD-binding protein [Legionella sp.]OJY48580.1 MAG: hypothetical protein BGO90_01395 [Legionella sp. 40-6]
MTQARSIRNWGKTFTYTPKSLFYPTHKEEILSLVAHCNQQRQQVRPLGSRYSYTPLICSEEVAISLDDYSGIEEINPEELTVIVRAGTKISLLEQELFSRGYSLYNLGDINQQTIAGLIATGSHGTGSQFGIASTQVVWIELVTADGKIVECSPTLNPELFKAAQVSLGTLGIITRIKLKILPRYYLHQERTVTHFEEAMAHFYESIQENRNYEFFWFPYTDFVYEKRHNLASQTTGPHRYKKLFNDYVLENGALWCLCEMAHAMPAFYRKHANGLLKKLSCSLDETIPSIECYATTRWVNHREIEYSIPVEEALNTLQEIRQLLNEHPTHVSFPVEVRYVKADDIYLSPNYQRNTVWIAVHAYTRDEHEAVFKDVEQVFLQHHGRPHWGKMHWLEHEQIKDLYPCLSQFKKIQHQLDPQGIFLNGYLRKLLGIVN